MSERVGDVLRGVREQRGLDLADVATRTRIPTRHLRAIETGSYEGLPAATYSAGFVKTYARLLGLDGQALAQQFRDELSAVAQAPVRREIYEPADPARTPGRALAWTALVAAIVLALGYLYWRGATLSENPRALAAAGSAEPRAAVPAPRAKPIASPPPIAAQPAVLAADSAVWIKVYEKAGPTLFMGVLEPGKTYTIPATATDPRLQTSRPNALAITVGTARVPPLGPPERLVKDVSLAPDALLARLTRDAAPGQPATAAPPSAG